MGNLLDNDAVVGVLSLLEQNPVDSWHAAYVREKRVQVSARILASIFYTQF